MTSCHSAKRQASCQSWRRRWLRRLRGTQEASKSHSGGAGKWPGSSGRPRASPGATDFTAQFRRLSSNSLLLATVTRLYRCNREPRNETSKLCSAVLNALCSFNTRVQTSPVAWLAVVPAPSARVVEVPTSPV